MSEELLYTQEDIGEWMSACNKLQVSLRELEDDIKAKDKQLAIYKRALELMAISYFGNNECIRFVNTGFQAESDVCLIEYFLDQAKKELEEQDVEN